MLDPSGIPGELPEGIRQNRRELRRRGVLFGLAYDLRIRVVELVDDEVETAGPLLLPPGSRLITGTTANADDIIGPAPDAVERWMSEGGR